MEGSVSTGVITSRGEKEEAGWKKEKKKKTATKSRLERDTHTGPRIRDRVHSRPRRAELLFDRAQERVRCGGWEAHEQA